MDERGAIHDLGVCGAVHAQGGRKRPRPIHATDVSRDPGRIARRGTCFGAGSGSAAAATSACSGEARTSDRRKRRRKSVYNTPAPTNPPIPVSLGTSKYHYTRAPKGFPNLIAPYRPIRVPEPVLTNSPRIDQLIHDGKLELTLQDAVEVGS